MEAEREEMKEYNVQVCYEMSDAMDYVVEARNQAEAKKKAEVEFIKECSGNEQITEIIAEEKK